MYSSRRLAASRACSARLRGCRCAPSRLPCPSQRAPPASGQQSRRFSSAQRGTPWLCGPPQAHAQAHQRAQRRLSLLVVVRPRAPRRARMSTRTTSSSTPSLPPAPPKPPLTSSTSHRAQQRSRVPQFASRPPARGRRRRGQPQAAAASPLRLPRALRPPTPDLPAVAARAHGQLQWARRRSLRMRRRQRPLASTSASSAQLTPAATAAQPPPPALPYTMPRCTPLRRGRAGLGAAMPSDLRL